jgi:hypothetical protein
MRRPRNPLFTAFICAAFLAPLCLPNPAEAIPKNAEISLYRLGQELGCGKGKDGIKGIKIWCLATSYIKKGRAPRTPGTGVFYGMSVALPAKGPYKPALLKTLHASSMLFSMNPKALKAKISSIKPSNDKEKKELLASLSQVTNVLRGRIPKFNLKPNLASYLLQLQKNANYEVKKKKKMWIIRGASTAYVRRVGFRAWVVVEVPKTGSGIFLSLFTDRAYVR